MFIAALTFIPGGIGVFEGGMVGLFVFNDMMYEAALATMILIRLVSIGLFSIIGLVCLRIISK